jgi:hypothetical protein
MKKIFINGAWSNNKVHTDAGEDFFTNMTMKAHEARGKDTWAIVAKLIKPMLINHVLCGDLCINGLSLLHNTISKVGQENCGKHDGGFIMRKGLFQNDVSLSSGIKLIIGCGLHYQDPQWLLSNYSVPPGVTEISIPEFMNIVELDHARG